MNIAITGHRGSIGSNVMLRLALEGITFTVTDIDVLENPSDAAEDLAGCDALIHLAYRHGFDHHHEYHFENAWKHVAFLCAAQRHGINRIVLAGSTHELAPKTPYGYAKKFTSQCVYRHSYMLGQEVVNVILPNIRFTSGLGSSLFALIARASRGECEYPRIARGARITSISEIEAASALVSAATTGVAPEWLSGVPSRSLPGTVVEFALEVGGDPTAILDTDGNPLMPAEG